MASFTLTNVRVFDGRKFGELQSVAVIDGRIVAESKHGVEVDGRGGYLLPGLIDAHIHLDSSENFTQLCKWGVTTGLDMASFSPVLLASLRAHKCVTDIRSAGIPASAPGSMHSRMSGFPKKGLLEGAEDAEKFVVDRINEGSDYIKLIADIPGPDQATLNPVVKAAHDHHKLCVAHAASYTTYVMAQQAGADIVTHAPLDKALNPSDARTMVDGHHVAVPTLIMMKGVVENIKAPFMNFKYASQSVTTLHEAGATVLAGTDANSQLGVIEAGKRADLLLLADDSIKDIHATRSIRKVWCCGSEISV